MKQILKDETTKNQLELVKTTVGVYDHYQNAIDAVIALEKGGIPVKDISFISTAEVVSGNLKTYSTEPIKNAPVAIGAVLGPILGILAGASIFAVPGLGFVYGAGAIVGAAVGFDMGVIGGGIGTLLMTLGISKEKVVTYKKQLKEGKYLVLLRSNKATAAKAKKIVHGAGNYIELTII